MKLKGFHNDRTLDTTFTCWNLCLNKFRTTPVLSGESGKKKVFEIAKKIAILKIMRGAICYRNYSLVNRFYRKHRIFFGTTYNYYVKICLCIRSHYIANWIVLLATRMVIIILLDTRLCLNFVVSIGVLEMFFILQVMLRVFWFLLLVHLQNLCRPHASLNVERTRYLMAFVEIWPRYFFSWYWSCCLNVIQEIYGICNCDMFIAHVIILIWLTFPVIKKNTRYLNLK